jgi:hypothetical protein
MGALLINLKIKRIPPTPLTKGGLFLSKFLIPMPNAQCPIPNSPSFDILTYVINIFVDR